MEVQSSNGHHNGNGVANGNGIANGNGVLHGNGVPAKQFKSDNGNRSKVTNFNAGPSKIDDSVLEKAKAEFMNYQNVGFGVMEMSHRSAEFAEIVNRAMKNIAELLDVPDNYKVLFLQGGATGQFSGVPLNLINRKPGRTADYIVTGTWSAKAAKEAEKYGSVNIVHEKLKKYTRVPEPHECTFNPEASYVYLCDNETVNGVEFPYVPDTGDVPLVADMSSNILSKPVDVKKYGVIVAGAQKNIGCAGVTLVIIREDLIGTAMKECPSVLDYKTMANANSLYNTPPSYSIYLLGLVLEWIKGCGGALAIGKRNAKKAQAVYSVIANSNGFYHCSVNEGNRSRMNVTFRIGGADGNPDLEAKFLSASKDAGMNGLKGHRSVGGMRASLYNAITESEAESLAAFMQSFYQENAN